MAAAALCFCLLAGLPHVYAGTGGGTSSGASIPGTVIPTTFDNTWNLNSFRTSDVSIKKSGVYHIEDSDPSSAEKYGIEVHGNGKTDGTNIHVTIYLEHVNIDSTLYTGASDPAIEILDGATVTLCFYGGTNTLKGAEGCAGIQKDSTYGELAVLAANDSSLDATGNGGAGIGGGSGDSVIGQNILINSGGWDGGVTATGTNGGAGIGGGPTGAGSNITVNCGDQITAASTSGGGAGIGGGRSANGSYITINGGDLVNASAVFGGAGIGGGTGGTGTYITINGGTVNASSVGAGAGVGGGCGAGGSYITIAGGTLTAVGGTNPNQLYGGSAIGGGQGASGDHITFSGGTTSALGGVGAAGVGGGSSGAASDITISSGSLTATGCVGGAGIGGGNGGSCTNIDISGGAVTALGGGGGGAGIGGGNGADLSNLEITGGVVEASGSLLNGAFSSSGSAGIGGGDNGSAQNIRISGGKVHAVSRSSPSCYTSDPLAIGCGDNGSSSKNIVVSTGESRYAHISCKDSLLPGVGSYSTRYYEEDSLKVCGDISLLSLEDPMIGAAYYNDYSHGKFGLYFRNITIEFADCKDSSGTAHTHSYVYSQSYSSTFDGSEHTTPDYHYQYCTVCGAVKAGTLQQHSYAWDTKTHEYKCTVCGYVRATDNIPPAILRPVSGEAEPTDPDVPIFIGGDPVSGKTEPVVTGSSFYMENAADSFLFTVQKGASELVSVKVDNSAVTANANGEYSIPPDNKQHTITATSESGLMTSVTISVCLKYAVNVYTLPGSSLVKSDTVGYGLPYSFTYLPENANYALVQVTCPSDASLDTTLPYSKTGSYEIPSVTAPLSVYLTPMLDSTAPTGSISIPSHTWTALSGDSTPVYLSGAAAVTLSASDAQSGMAAILYEISDHPMTLAQLQAETSWQSYTGSPFTLDGEGRHYIGVKLTDKAGNTSYLCSADIAVDHTAPKAILAGSGADLPGTSAWLNKALIKVQDVTPCTVKLDSTVLTPGDGGVYALPMTEAASTLLLTDSMGLTSSYQISLHTNKLTGITPLAVLPDYPNGTVLSGIALPAQTTVTASYKGSETARISWDTAGVTYNFANKKGGAFTIHGTLALPDDVINPGGISLGVSLDVTILEAPKYAVTVTPVAWGGSLRASTALTYAGETVTLTVTPDFNRQVKSLSVRDSGNASVSVTKTGDWTYTYLQPVNGSTVSAVMEYVLPELVSVTQPADIGGLANGTVLSDIALPQTASILKTDGSSQEIAIRWNTDSVTYNFANKKGGSFTLTGALVLPQDVPNTSHVSVAVSMQITILEAPKYSVTVIQPERGTLSADTALIYAGDRVTLTITLNAHTRINSVTMTDAAGNASSVKNVGGVYSYLQPVGGSTVTARLTYFLEHTGSSAANTADIGSGNENPAGSGTGDENSGSPKTPDDVSEDDWFRDDVLRVQEKGLMTNTGKNKFDPYAPVTRGMLSTVLYRLAGSPKLSAGSLFKDVAQGSWYESAINWAVQSGVANGSGGGRYRPDAPLTREQAAVLLYRYAALNGYSLTGSADLGKYRDAGQISGYAQKALAWACGEGLLSGRPGSLLDPRGGITRCELAALLNRFSALFGA